MRGSSNMVGDSKTTSPGKVEIVEFHYHFEKIDHKLYYYRGLKEFENERGYLTDTCLSA